MPANTSISSTPISENALSFSLNFDPTQWRFASVELGDNAVGGALSLNAKLVANGRIGIALALPPGKSLEAGLHSLVVIKFAAAEGGGTLSPVTGFGDWPVTRELASVKADALTAEWTPSAGRELVNVSAISFEQTALARGSLVAAFGVGLGTVSLAAEDLPLPFELAGTTVRITDSAGREHLVPLLFVSPMQVNYLLPAEATAGLAEVKIVSADGTISIGRIEIVN